MDRGNISVYFGQKLQVAVLCYTLYTDQEKRSSISLEDCAWCMLPIPTAGTPRTSLPTYRNWNNTQTKNTEAFQMLKFSRVGEYGLNLNKMQSSPQNNK